MASRARVGPLEETGRAQADRGPHGRQLRAPLPDALPEVWRRRRLHAHAAFQNLLRERKVSEPGIHHVQGKETEQSHYLALTDWCVITCFSLSWGSVFSSDRVSMFYKLHTFGGIHQKQIIWVVIL